MWCHISLVCLFSFINKLSISVITLYKPLFDGINECDHIVFYFKGVVMNKKIKSKAKVVRDVGRTSVHFKVQDDIFKRFNELLNGKTKQEYFEEHVINYVKEREPQLEIKL